MPNLTIEMKYTDHDGATVEWQAKVEPDEEHFNISEKIAGIPLTYRTIHEDELDDAIREVIVRSV